MSRSVWKGPFVDPILLKSSFRNKKSTFKHVWSRSSVIPFSLLGQSVLVHNGKLFKKIFITREKIGYKFGEFAFTKKYTPKTKILKKVSRK